MSVSNGINCITNVKCEPKTRRLAKSSYERPKVTFTDTLQSNDKMKEKLQNYIRVDDIDDVSLNTHLRYVTLKDGEQRFCLGGLLKKKHNKYVVLSNGTFSWSVQRYHFNEEDDEPIFETAFFRILSKEEQQGDLIEKQSQEIEKLKKLLGKTYDDKSLAFGGGRNKR